MRKMVGALVLPLFLFAGVARASPEVPMDAASLAHALDRLGSTARVLYLAAHPDDENTRLLAWLAGGRHVHAAYLSLTRGGGGQNLIGTEQGPLLDVVRTEELLAARRIDGATQFFTRARDFGFSKRPEEALAIWGHQEVLADVVEVVRAFRPDVIVTRFDEERPNHGHHTASYLLAREAFVAAADPAAFPEQIERGLAPWQPVRLVYNHSHWRGDPPADALALEVGGFDPRRGLGFGEIAAISRSEHKSQGFGARWERGSIVEHFVHVAGAPASADLLDGVETSWARYGAAGERVDAAVAKAREALGRDRPQAALPALLEVRAALSALPPDRRVEDAQADLDRILAGAAGLFVRATAQRQAAAPGDTVEIEVEILGRLGGEVEARSVTFPDGAEVKGPGRLEREGRQTLARPVALPADAPISTPHWLGEAPTPGRYDVPEGSFVGAPLGPAPLEVAVEFSVAGAPLVVRAPVVHAWVDPVHGERVRRFQIVPPATVTPLREAVMIRQGHAASVALRVRAGADGVQGRVGLDLPAGWKVEPAVREVAFDAAGQERTVRFSVQAPAGARGVQAAPWIEIDGKRWSLRADTIDYPHIPVQVVLRRPALHLQPLELQVPEGLVGYVPGAGDSIAADLSHVGVQVETVDDATLRAGDLDRFAAIVVGIRAYNTRPVLRAAHARLMDWVERGGTLLVQYNVSSRWDPLDQPIGPWPIELGRLARVTDEKAQVTPLAPQHAVLRHPHVIGPADFEGWVQERGLYFAVKWDERYEPIFSMADPEEEALAGGTLVARHGEGRYVYSGLSFFRQLRAGVPGAYRLFVNFISRNHPDA